jgi:hypothetical protein
LNRALKTFLSGARRMRAIEVAAVAMERWERAAVVKTTRITIETESLLVVRRGKTIVTWCPVCCAEVEAMAVENDSLGDDISSDVLSQWLATGKLHFWRHGRGPLQICLPSLLQCFASEDARSFQAPRRTAPKTGEGQ